MQLSNAHPLNEEDSLMYEIKFKLWYLGSYFIGMPTIFLYLQLEA